MSSVEGQMSRVDGKKSRLKSRGSRVKCRGSRVKSRGSNEKVEGRKYFKDSGFYSNFYFYYWQKLKMYFNFLYFNTDFKLNLITLVLTVVFIFSIINCNFDVFLQQFFINICIYHLVMPQNRK